MATNVLLCCRGRDRMKLTIDIPKNQVEPLCAKITKWREMSPFPLTNLEQLENIEKEISRQLTQIVLSSDTLNDVLIKIKEEK